jgi:hypothetical protein
LDETNFTVLGTMILLNVKPFWAFRNSTQGLFFSKPLFCFTLAFETMDLQHFGFKRPRHSNKTLVSVWMSWVFNTKVSRNHDFEASVKQNHDLGGQEWIF